MNARLRAQFLFALCPLSFVLALTGCGLADYAGQMSSEAARVRAWDEESALLGPGVKMPELPKKDDKDMGWNVFLRLPRGVSDAPKTAGENSSQAKLFGSLVQYEGSNALGIANVYLGVSEQKDFENSVFNYFSVASGGTDIKVPRSATVINAVGQALPPEVSVKQRLAEGPQNNYSFNFYEHGGTRVAVVFQLDKTNSARANAAILASLATLGVGDDEAPRLRNAYTKSKRPARK
jgi:hypothetical protein